MYTSLCTLGRKILPFQPASLFPTLQYGLASSSTRGLEGVFLLFHFPTCCMQASQTPNEAVGFSASLSPQYTQDLSSCMMSGSLLSVTLQRTKKPPSDVINRCCVLTRRISLRSVTSKSAPCKPARKGKHFPHS